MASSSSHRSGDGMLDPRLQFYQAIRRNDWYTLRDHFDKLPLAQTEPITEDGETVLILVAKQGKKSNLLLRRLIEYMPDEALTQCDHRGNTALHAAAVVGDVDGARILLSRNPDLADISNEDGHLPFHVAATHVHRDLMLFLLNVATDNVESNLFVGQNGAKLICNLISSGFYDVALLLIQKYPTLACDPAFPPLEAIAQEPSAFPSGVKLSFWKRLIYTHRNGKMFILRKQKRSPPPPPFSGSPLHWKSPPPPFRPPPPPPPPAKAPSGP